MKRNVSVERNILGEMMGTRLAAVVILLLALAAPALAGQPPDGNGLCPEGFGEEFNVNEPGCTFCFAQTDCNVDCVGPPTCFCTPGNTACCADTPCCAGCPDPKPLSCNTASCGCEPESCCFTVCPPPSAAPTSSTAGLALLAIALVALGSATVGVARRRR